MSGREWELLARIASGEIDGAAGVCRELALAIGAERLFCVVRQGSAQQVYGFDYEGYPVANAAARLPEELLAQARHNNAKSHAPAVVRRPALDTRGAAVVATLRGRGVECTLVIEHRFAPTQLSALDDREICRWVMLCALAEPRPADDRMKNLERERAPVDHAQGLGAVNMASISDLAAQNDAVDPAQRLQSLGALENSGWNISRAARDLGLTRHGLKKRMRRLGIRRPSHIAPANDDAD